MFKTLDKLSISRIVESVFPGGPALTRSTLAVIATLLGATDTWASASFTDVGYPDGVINLCSTWSGVTSGEPVTAASAMLELGPLEPVTSAPHLGPALIGHTPNPMRQAATIRFTSDKPAAGLLEVFTILGQRLRKEELVIQAGDNEVQLIRGSLAQGMYLYRVSWPGFMASRKVTIIN
jgi:hypothetical protein